MQVGNSTYLMDLSPNSVRVKELEGEICDLKEMRMNAVDPREKKRLTWRINSRSSKIHRLKEKLGYKTKVVQKISKGKKIIKGKHGVFVREWKKTWNPFRSCYISHWITRALTENEHKEYLVSLKGVSNATNYRNC